MALGGTLSPPITELDSENIIVGDIAGPNSTFGTSTLFYDTQYFTTGPLPVADNSGYLKNATDTLQTRFEFYTDAAEIQVKVERSDSNIHFKVDGVTALVVDTGSYAERLYTFKFPSMRNRKVEIFGTSFGFGGVYVEGVDLYSVWPILDRATKPLLGVMTDSYGIAPTADSSYGQSFVEYLAEKMGVDVWSDSIDSTGWASIGSSLTTTRAAHMATLETNPNYIFGAMGFNDKLETEGDIKAGINDWYDDIIVAFPYAEIVVAGPWFPEGTDAALADINTWVSEEAASLGITYIDLSDIFNTVNKSLYISTDNVHPNDLGHQFLANRIDVKLKGVGAFELLDLVGIT